MWRRVAETRSAIVDRRVKESLMMMMRLNKQTYPTSDAGKSLFTRMDCYVGVTIAILAIRGIHANLRRIWAIVQLFLPRHFFSFTCRADDPNVLT
ncbi:hypothetical protein VNO78_00418 [Psophocarpus tetragonolobus]|uniref:Uncharacterized protein n=1 Tax=Psophocarpus tetragonolobus TaxID=3891 RepID=A0AAN9T991_PSOTE